MATALLIKTETLTSREHWVVAPLGILSLAAAARREGHDATVLDLRVVPVAAAPGAVDTAIERGVDVIGLSCVSWQVPLLARVARRARRIHPGALIIAGGPGPTSDTEECLRLSGVDACVLGEGEATFCEILGKVAAGDDWRGVDGIARLDETGNVVRTRPRALWPDPDTLPTPAWDLHDFVHYSRFLGMGMRRGMRAEVQTSRGCPYHCSFCHSFFGKRFRARSPDNVLGELSTLRTRYGIRRFAIIDDYFNCDPGRAKEILRRISREIPGSSISFPNGIRGDTLDADMIRLLKEAGTDFVAVGVSTASPRLQALTKKRVDLPALEANLRLMRKAGLHTAAFFMVGFPEETEEEVEKTFDMASRFPVDLPFISVLVPFRGTQAWEALDDGTRSRSTVCSLDPRTGWGAGGFSTIPRETLLSRAETIMKRRLLKPGNWYVVFNELAWRWAFSRRRPGMAVGTEACGGGRVGRLWNTYVGKTPLGGFEDLPQ